MATEAPAIFLRLSSRRWIGVLRVGATHAEGRAAAFYRPRDGARRRGPRRDSVECGQGAPFARNAAESWRHAMGRSAASGATQRTPLVVLCGQGYGTCVEQRHLVLTLATHRRKQRSSLIDVDPRNYTQYASPPGPPRAGRSLGSTTGANEFLRLLPHCAQKLR